LEHRADDNEETIRQRLMAYEVQTRPLIDHYRRLGLLRDVNGNRPPTAITAELLVFGSGMIICKSAAEIEKLRRQRPGW